MQITIDLSVDEYIGRMVKEARQKKGLTQQELAEKIKTSHMMMSHLERGKRSWKMSRLEKVAQELNRPVKSFLP